MLSIVREDESALAGVISISFTESVNAEADLKPCVSSAFVEIEAYGAQTDAPEAGERLTLYDTQNNIRTKIGYFFAEPSIRTKNSYTLTAYDNAKKLDVDFSAWLKTATFPMTVHDLVSAACTVAGVTLGSASWPLSDHIVNAFYADGLSCRDVVLYAAEIACRFVRCNADGELIFGWYSAASGMRIYPTAGTNNGEIRYAYQRDGLQYENYETTALARVAVHCVGVENDAFIYPDDVTSGNTLHVYDNLLLTNANETFYADVAENIFNEISAVGTYRPFSTTLFTGENPFRAGHIVNVTDSQGVSFVSVVMAMTVSAGGAELTSTGNEEYADSADTTKALNQLAQAVQDLSEDTAAEFEAVRTQTAVSIQTMQEQITSTVETTYLSQEAFDVAINGDDEVEGILAQISTSIQQTADGIRYDFESFADNTSGAFDTIYSYIQMAGGTITLGKADSAVQLEIRNDGIAIIVDGKTVTYWQSDAFVSPSKLEIPEGGRLILGSYAYIPRSNGSLDFVWVGE